MKTTLENYKKISIIPALFLMLAFPASDNFQLRSYGFGSGGSDQPQSANYEVEGLTGDLTQNQAAGNSVDLGPGFFFVQQAHVPTAPDFTNDGDYYNRLYFKINRSNNPADSRYAIAISDDNFVTTRYVQSDLTIGDVLGLEDYQKYQEWGGDAGNHIIGLDSGTTYRIKVKAWHGKFTETDYGPPASATTSNPNLGFDIDVSSIDEETAPPYAMNIGNLDPDTVLTGTEKIWVDFSTNADFGGRVYLRGKNEGLESIASGYKINSATANLDSANEGFGIQNDSVAQSSGGPLTAIAPYNNSGNQVGAVDNSLTEILSSAGRIIGGRASFLIKAKTGAVTPAAGDYQETLTMIASGTF